MSGSPWSLSRREALAALAAAGLAPLVSAAPLVRLPASRRAREVRLLVSKADPQHAADVLSLTVPSILDHEVVAIIYSAELSPRFDRLEKSEARNVTVFLA